MDVIPNTKLVTFQPCAVSICLIILFMLLFLSLAIGPYFRVQGGDSRNNRRQTYEINFETLKVHPYSTKLSSPVFDPISGGISGIFAPRPSSSGGPVSAVPSALNPLLGHFR